MQKIKLYDKSIIKDRAAMSWVTSFSRRLQYEQPLTTMPISKTVAHVEAHIARIVRPSFRILRLRIDEMLPTKTRARCHRITAWLVEVPPALFEQPDED